MEDKLADVFPRPDPTKLTTEQLTREISSLKELFTIRIEALNRRTDEAQEMIRTTPDLIAREVEGLTKHLETRLTGIDTATNLRHQLTDSLPLRMDEKIAALAKLQDEKFQSIQTQFSERDVRTEQSSRDSKIAVEAALQAAKEAVGEQNKSSALAIAKSESATTKQIDQLANQMQSLSKNFDDKIADVKERLNRADGGMLGQQMSAAFVFSIISGLVSIISLIAVIFIALRH